MERNLALDLVRVTEAAAIASARTMGKGNSHLSDQEAVTAMRRAFDAMEIHGTVRIGEGERDEAPMLFIGEEVGRRHEGDPRMDLALDPLEGTSLCAYGRSGALAVIAMAPEGGFLHAPDIYMNKIAVGPAGRGVIDITLSATENLQRLAEAKKVTVKDLTAIVLDRPRHEALIREIREAGARVRLISDGDVHAAIATCNEDTGIDILFGIGGAPEGVLAAAALRCMRGEIQGQLQFANDEQRARARRLMGEDDIERVLGLDDLASGDVLFAATGVTTGELLKGVRFFSGGCMTHSLVMRSRSGTVRVIEAQHDFERKPSYTSEGLLAE
ncbi:MAG: class II fructose-bisphosphatase [Myxococcota bacterium]|jgi:fructose-1,6-bisphosphatase II|nr:class II fructose-bisphosphatase [Myxococcota bacterium]